MATWLSCDICIEIMLYDIMFLFQGVDVGAYNT